MMQAVATDTRDRSETQSAARQYAALCWRMHRGRVQVLLVTSRDTGRWIMPKGWPIDGKSAAETAAIEAWEEAGVEGTMDTTAPIGLYEYEKLRSKKVSIPCVVNVFSLRVKKLADKFPERKQRRRKWFDSQIAARKVAEHDLRQLLSDVTLQGKRLAFSAGDQNPA